MTVFSSFPKLTTGFAYYISEEGRRLKSKNMFTARQPSPSHSTRFHEARSFVAQYDSRPSSRGSLKANQPSEPEVARILNLPAGAFTRTLCHMSLPSLGGGTGVI